MIGAVDLSTLPGFKPYIYGATLGQPSKAQPLRVLNAMKAGITEADRRPAPAVIEAPPQASPEPGPDEPERCEDCGYLLTAPGHKITCEGA